MRNRALENSKQSKLEHVMWTPIKILGKARDLYMRGIEDCVGKTGLDAVLVSGGPIPRGFGGAVSSRSGDEEFGVRERLRTSFKRKSDRVLVEPSNQRRRGRRPAMAASGRSYRVVLGRIDENRACCFEEDESMKKFLLAPKTVPPQRAS